MKNVLQKKRNISSCKKYTSLSQKQSSNAQAEKLHFCFSEFVANYQFSMVFTWEVIQLNYIFANNVTRIYIKQYSYIHTFVSHNRLVSRWNGYMWFKTYIYTHNKALYFYKPSALATYRILLLYVWMSCRLCSTVRRYKCNKFHSLCHRLIIWIANRSEKYVQSTEQESDLWRPSSPSSKSKI